MSKRKIHLVLSIENISRLHHKASSENISVSVAADAALTNSLLQPEGSRCPRTYRREEAVKVLILMGWRWDGKQWNRPVVIERQQVLPGVIADLESRIAKGAKEYGEPLTTHNGRKALLDAYEEVLDMAMYLKQELMERDQ